MMTIVFNLIEFILILTSAIVFQSLYLEKDDLTKLVIDWSDTEKVQDRRDLVSLLSIIGSIIAIIIFLVSSLSKRVICRCIPSANLNIPAIVI